jgi:Kdo2-lipid IVA lauroyltransferase/acyltransferase
LGSRRALSKVILADDLDDLFGARPDRRGIVIATAHTGNWDLVACAAARRASLTVITKHLSVGWLDCLWQNLRSRHGLNLVSEGEAAKGALAVLKRGGLVAMMIDQVPMRARGVSREPFLGAEASVDLAPALLALRGRVPLIVAFPYRDEGGLHRMHVARRIEPPGRPSRAWAEAAMRTATQDLDAFVRGRPEQWLWMHRRWSSYEMRRRASYPESTGLCPLVDR